MACRHLLTKIGTGDIQDVQKSLMPNVENIAGELGELLLLLRARSRRLVFKPFGLLFSQSLAGDRQDLGAKPVEVIALRFQNDSGCCLAFWRRFGVGCAHHAQHAASIDRVSIAIEC